MREQVRQFLEFLTAEKGFSNNTRDAYRNDLTQLTEFVEVKVGPAAYTSSKGWAKVNPSILSGFVMHLRDRDYAATTVARKIAALKSFFGFLLDEGVVSEDPMEGHYPRHSNLKRLSYCWLSHRKKAIRRRPSETLPSCNSSTLPACV